MPQVVPDNDRLGSHRQCTGRMGMPHPVGRGLPTLFSQNGEVAVQLLRRDFEKSFRICSNRLVVMPLPANASSDPIRGYCGPIARACSASGGNATLPALSLRCQVAIYRLIARPPSSAVMSCMSTFGGGLLKNACQQRVSDTNPMSLFPSSNVRPVRLRVQDERLAPGICVNSCQASQQALMMSSWRRHLA
jgi:hypothetical protein